MKLCFKIKMHFYFYKLYYCYFADVSAIYPWGGRSGLLYCISASNSTENSTVTNFINNVFPAVVLEEKFHKSPSYCNLFKLFYGSEFSQVIKFQQQWNLVFPMQLYVKCDAQQLQQLLQLLGSGQSTLCECVWWLVSVGDSGK